jgi:hypothetical protein
MAQPHETPDEQAGQFARRLKRLGVRFVLPGVITFIVYFLSIGPAFRLASDSHNSLAEYSLYIYFPLLALGRWHPFGELLFWYLALRGWRPIVA